ncbi:MAG: hypothetical protein AAF571_06770 [Verrucomicrobiota bacterium]
MNAFEVLEVAQKPVVDSELLKERLHQLSKTHHGEADGDSSEQWHQINAAYQILTGDVSRLRHLLELNGEEGLNDSAVVPEEVMELFGTVGPALHQADEVIRQMDAAESALEKAMLQEDVMTLAMDLQQRAAQVGEFRSKLVRGIATLDKTWEKKPQIDPLKTHYRQLVYVARWAHQLDEKLFRLMNF